MSRWTAVVPLKLGDERKSRLAARLPLAARVSLSEAMAARVLRCLGELAGLEACLLLAPMMVPGLTASWVRDEGRGLNAELDAVRARHKLGRLLVIHADLPLLQVEDVHALMEAAERAGAAIAPDRHRQGTNALALTPDAAAVRFAFGPQSFARHVQALGSAEVVMREGLAFDLDTPDDLDEARRRGALA